MIDITKENLETLGQAARGIPGRTGRGVSTSAIWRWTTVGVRGCVLETILIGGVRYTSKEAMERFIAAQNKSAAAAHSPDGRQAAKERAERELKDAGI